MQIFTGKEQQDIISMKKMIELHYKTASVTLPTAIYNFINDFGIITGGISASVHAGKKPNDIDVYLKDANSLIAWKSAIESGSKEFMDQVSDVNVKYGLETLVEGKLVTARATTFKCGIQVITMDDIKIREVFDFIHCMPWYDISADMYHISRSQYDSITRKVIVPNTNIGAEKPTKHRVTKYLERGWTYPEGLDSL